MKNKLCIFMMSFLLIVTLSLFGEGEQEAVTKKSEIVLIAHQVHEGVFKGGPDKGRNLIEEFENTFNAKVFFQTGAAGFQVVRP